MADQEEAKLIGDLNALRARIERLFISNGIDWKSLTEGSSYWKNLKEKYPLPAQLRTVKTFLSGETKPQGEALKNYAKFVLKEEAAQAAGVATAPSPEEPTQQLPDILETTNDDSEESGEDPGSELTVLLQNPALLRDRINQFLAKHDLQLGGTYFNRMRQLYALPVLQNMKAFLANQTNGHPTSREKYAQFLLAEEAAVLLGSKASSPSPAAPSAATPDSKTLQFDIQTKMGLVQIDVTPTSTAASLFGAASSNSPLQLKMLDAFPHLVGVKLVTGDPAKTVERHLGAEPMWPVALGWKASGLVAPSHRLEISCNSRNTDGQLLGNHSSQGLCSEQLDLFATPSFSSQSSSPNSPPPAHRVYQAIQAEALTPVDPVRCPFCNRLLSPLLLTYHIQQHNTEPAQKTCPICGKEAEFIFGHMENHQADIRRVAAAVAAAATSSDPDPAPAPEEAQPEPAKPTKTTKPAGGPTPAAGKALPVKAQAGQPAAAPASTPQPQAPAPAPAQLPSTVVASGEDRKASVARLQGITWPAAPQWPQGLGAEEKLSELFRCLQEWRAEAEVGNQKEFPSAKERRPDDLGRLHASLQAIIRSSQSVDANRWREVARRTDAALQILSGDHYPGEDELGPELDRTLVQNKLAVSQSVRIATLNGSHVITKQFLANDSSYSQTLRELQISLTVKHPNIAQGLGWYRDTDGMVVLVTQLYGPNLATVVRALLPSGTHCHRHAMPYHTQANSPHACDYRFLNGRLPWLQAKTFLLQAAAGLAYLHAERIFHRDFGAHNLVLTANWDSVVIIDFGLSTRAKGEYTTGTVDSRAKSPFMSPRRFARALAHSNSGSGDYAVDLETRVQDDLWPLACVLNFLLDPVQPWFAEPETARKALPNGPRPLPDRFSAELRALAAPEPQCRDVTEFKTKLERVEFLVARWEDYSLAWLPAPQPTWASPTVLPNFYTRGSWPDGREVRHSEEAFLEFKGQLLTYLRTCSLCGALGKPDHKQCRELKKSQSAEFDQLEKIRAHLTRVAPLWNSVSDIQTGPMGARTKAEPAEGQPKKPKSFGPPDLTREVRLLSKIVRDMYKVPPALRRPAVKDKPEADRPPINWDSNGRRGRAWAGLRPPSLSLAASFAGGRLEILRWLDQAFRVDWFGNLICPFSLNNSQCFADVDHVWPWKLGGSSHEHPAENEDKPYNLTMLHFRANRNVKSDVPLQFLNPADLQTGYSTLQAVHLLNMESGPRLLPFLLGWDPAQPDHGYQPPKHFAECFDLATAMTALSALANFELKRKEKPAAEKAAKSKKKSTS